MQLTFKLFGHDGQSQNFRFDSRMGLEVVTPITARLMNHLAEDLDAFRNGVTGAHDSGDLECHSQCRN